MEIKEKGILSIHKTANSNPFVIFKSVKGTIWMDRNDLCDLFGIYMNSIDECLQSILKMNLFNMNDSCRYHRVVKRNRVCFEIIEVNLKIITAIAFRIESENARILREWFIRRITENHKFSSGLCDIGFSGSLN